MFNPFTSLTRVAKVVKRLGSGEVLASDETTANFGMSRLRLTAKRETGSGEVYAVLSLRSSGNHQYCHLSPQELDELANIARMIQSTARQGRLPDSAEFLATSRVTAAGGDAKSASPRLTRAGRFSPLKNLFRWLALVVAALLVILLVAWLWRRPSDAIPYSQLLAQVDAGNLHDVTFAGQSVSGHFMDSKTFHSVAPDAPSLLGTLMGHNVVIAAEPSSCGFSVWTLLDMAAIILMIAAMIDMFRRRRR